MKKCRNCNREITSDEAKFCPFCGSKFPPPARFCTECGYEINYSYKFCLRCGNQFNFVDEPNPTPNPTPKPKDIDYGPNNNTHTTTFMYKVPVSYRLGRGATAFSLAIGSIIFTEKEISFVGSLGSGNNHSYSLNNIASTEFKIVRLGISPNPGYVVKLKNGEEKIYIYSPFSKGQLSAADQAIKTKI